MARPADPRPPIVVAGGTARIPLTRGAWALIDEDDLAIVGGFPWFAHWNGRQLYAVRNTPRPGRGWIYMHRAILGAAPGSLVDHADGDSLNNRRGNLRLADKRRNGWNRARLNRNNTSGFSGVVRASRSANWVAQAYDDGRRVHVGTFPTPEAAARAYDRFVLATRGEFARTNFPREEYE